MLTYFQAIILGLLQGVTELFPISSLGHSVVLPRLLGWQIDQTQSFFLIFLVATHFATATALFVLYVKDWMQILAGIVRSLKIREIRPDDTYAKLGWLLVVATVPAGILGLLLEDYLKHLFASPQIVALFLIGNGILLYGTEIFYQKFRSGRQTESVQDIQIARMTWTQSIKIGLIQSLALIPGFSRTGSTIAGGLFEGLSHKDAVRFSFLLATPIIGAAALLKLPELASSVNPKELGPIFAGTIIAGVAAFFAAKFLEKYFTTNTLKPFGVYCFVFGIFLSVWFLHH